MADHLRAIVRAGDVVGRLGGDEFAVLLASPAGADRVAEQVVLAVADLAVAYDVGVGASVGSACWPADGVTFAELVHTADVRMYAAKRDGRARAAVPSGPVAGSRLCRDAVAGGLITRQARTSTTGHP